ncbi:hypothetical protein FRUB_06329 [Fimbriiglobus ruber]|uniref:Uncharacterized protein n=1 Tax=Fimbriiglobus ruber TaxID=1908690 RepID=A0A225DD96_9BACT|nr:hypothetical protein FRUB_06329 [Fimbriiglobus ruber]
MKETPFSFFDTVTGGQVTIYESVVDPKRYYMSPVFCITPWPDGDHEKKFLETPVSGGYEYHFRVVYFHSGMEQQAIDTLKKHGVTPGHVSPMVVSAVGYTVRGVPAATVTPLGEVGTCLHLGMAPGVLTVRVPESGNRDFRALLDSDKGVGVRIDAKCYYNAIDLKRAVLHWGVDEIRESEAYKKLATDGGQFVTAEQVHGVFQSVCKLPKFVEFSDDVFLAETLHKRADEFFKKLVDDSREWAIRNEKDAEALDAELRKGTGLKATDYQPNVQMVKFLNTVRTVTDLKTANEHAKTAFHTTTTGGNGNVGFRYGPFSIGLGASRNWVQGGSEMFKTENDYKAFRDEYLTKRGDEVIITPRSLKLVEKATLTARLSWTASAMMLQPLHMAKNFTVSQYSGPAVATKEKLLDEQKRLTQKLAEAKTAVVKQIDVLVAIPDWTETRQPDWPEHFLTAMMIQDQNQCFHGGKNEIEVALKAGTIDKDWAEKRLVGINSGCEEARKYAPKMDAHRKSLEDRRTAEKKTLLDLMKQQEDTQAELNKVSDLLARRLW